jgi:hypothetical protein
MAKKLKVGDELNGYRITQVFGPGAMAISYAARSPSGQRVFFKQYKSPAVTVDWYRDYVRYQKELNRRIAEGPARNYCVRAIDAFEAVWGKFAALQARLGGDALIGKKLFSLFKAAGFSEIKLSIQPEIHYAGTETFRPWVENLIGNVAGGAGELERQGLATAAEIRETIAELRCFAERDDACTIFYWNRAAGVKS